jgi:hypothetical protein
MRTNDHLENITEYSQSVQVVVKDSGGALRIFNVDSAKVFLRYVTESEAFAYHPGNIEKAGKFVPESGHHLELVIATETSFTLQVTNEC